MKYVYGAIGFFLSLILIGCNSSSSTDHKDHSQQQQTAATQAEWGNKNCPVMGDPIDKNVSIVYQDKKLYFCCDKCIPKFNKDPEKYMKAMAKEESETHAAPHGEHDHGQHEH